jgi:three-Cys-motif partner protein
MKKTPQKPDAKKNVLAHTQAKLDLYKGYLEHYLRALSYADFCKRINIFDIYCGAGVYDDGKKGSPLLAIDCINNVNTEIVNKGKPLKQIHLSVNDYDAQKIENVKCNADTQNIGNCNIEYYNKDANEMLDMVARRVSSYTIEYRNLVFIDPYGYSNINKDKFISLLHNKYTEIILFLPVMQMYRFTKIAFIDEERPHYENLRQFIISFFKDYSSIRTNTIFDYINSIKEALSINNTYFTCSHYIEREKGRYYALFFISSSIYGLEKMLETKWKLDPIKGKGYNQQKDTSQMNLFEEEFEEIDKMRELSYLEGIIYQYISKKENVSNNELYELTLRNEFLPKHTNQVLENLIKQNRIQCNSSAFGINYNNFKNKVIISNYKIL